MVVDRARVHIAFIEDSCTLKGHRRNVSRRVKRLAIGTTEHSSMRKKLQLSRRLYAELDLEKKNPELLYTIPVKVWLRFCRYVL